MIDFERRPLRENIVPALASFTITFCAGMAATVFVLTGGFPNSTQRRQIAAAIAAPPAIEPEQIVSLDEPPSSETPAIQGVVQEAAAPVVESEGTPPAVLTERVDIDFRLDAIGGGTAAATPNEGAAPANAPPPQNHWPETAARSAPPPVEANDSANLLAGANVDAQAASEAPMLSLDVE